MLNLGGRTNMRLVRHMHSVGMLALVAGMPLTYTCMTLASFQARCRRLGTNTAARSATSCRPPEATTSGLCGHLLACAMCCGADCACAMCCGADCACVPSHWPGAAPAPRFLIQSRKCFLFFFQARSGTWGAARLALVRVPWGLATERSPCCGSSGHKSTKASPPSALRRAQPQVRRLRTAHSGDGGHNPLVHPVWCVPS